MTNFLEIALSCIQRGWHVLPCWPETKDPMTTHGYKNASNDEAQVRAWWTRTPNANVAIATGASGLTVWDCDKGVTDEEGLKAFMAAHDVPMSFAVRTGRRPDFAVQVYYSDPIPSFNHWEASGYAGDIRGTTGYVMAAGSIHPASKEAYGVLWDYPVAPVPNFIRALKFVPRKGPDGQTLPPRFLDDGPIDEWRNDAMIRLLGKKRSEGADDDALREYALTTNEDRMVPPLDEEELERLIQNACKFPMPEPMGEVVLGAEPKPPVDWRTRYATFEQVRDAKPTSFFVEGFLALDSITALAAPVGQRKSLVALNVAHALCTGEALFDYFKVTRQPERVIYLCPEMGLSSFSTRLKAIGLLKYVGESLFCQTMDDVSLQLRDLNEELPGAVVIVDTLTRFVEGDQNKAEDMSKFAQEVFRLKRAGATILLLHHSVKGTGNGNGSLTLDSAMRGSTELAAFVTSCWATRLIDPDQPYNSPSLLMNVKQRDFESKPFEVTSGPDCRLHIAGEPGQIKELKSQKDADAEKVLAALLQGSPDMGINKLRDALKEAGFRKGPKWVTKKRAELRGSGVTLTSE